jgi:glyoxylase-like metal-dependent hydrolase (beta-lactamase superfamily II)
MSLQIKSLLLGPLETNCYIVGCGNPPGPVWLIDIGMWSKPMVDYLDKNGLKPEKILLTHCHADHIGGVEYVKQHYPDARILCPSADEEMLASPEKNLSSTFLMGIEAPPADELIAPGQTISMDSEEGLLWGVLDTSGHTAGGVSFYCESEGAVFTGDALFYRSIGRADIPGGDHELLVENIRNNLLSLPDETKVYPGHGPPTTIGEERKENPFLL